MKATLSWKLTAMWSLAAGGVLFSLLGLLALGGQSGPLMWLGPVGFAEPHDRRAFLALSRDTGPAARQVAAREDATALRIAPYNNAARLRLAYVEGLGAGGLRGEGLKRFAESYSLIPYDRTVAAWRIGYGLEHWPQLTPDLRNAVHAEAVAFGRVRSADAGVGPVLTSIHNPEGKVAAALWLRELAR